MMVLMFQREVAERIVAREDDEAYGRLARARQLARRDQNPVRHLAGRLRAAAEGHLFRRATGAARNARACDRRALEQVAAAAFGQRRKMLRQSLKSLAVDPARLAAAAGVDATRRAETIPVSRLCCHGP